MKETRYLLRVLCLITAMVGLASGADSSLRPNFVLIIADDVSVNDIGCYGHPTIRTPHIDQLAREGARFERAFLTASSCSPSRCSIITGRYPHNTGAPELHMPLPENQIPFPAVLKQQGYYTAQAGKWHLGENENVTGAFDRREGGGPGGEENWLEVLRQRDKTKPFFLWLASFDAHRGWDDKNTMKSYSLEEIQVPIYLVDDRQTRADLAAYYREITRFDYAIGEVVNELKQQGVYENTVILVMADNGRPFPRCKTRVYDSGMQTPLVISWPDGLQDKGKPRGGLVSSIDLAPTLLELAGIEPSDSFQGVSIAPLLKDGQARVRKYVFSEHNWHDYEAHERQVRTERYMYIRNARPQLMNQGPADSVRSPSHVALQLGRDTGNLTRAQGDVFLAPRPDEELFDCQNDPEQLVNLAADPAMAAILNRLRHTLDQWQKETCDTIPLQITPDQFDRETGKNNGKEWQRETTPGSERQAAECNQSGPI